MVASCNEVHGKRYDANEGWDERRYFAELEFDIIQKRVVAYFDYTAVPGGNCAARAPAELPSFALPASLARPRLPAMVDDAELRRNFAGWTQRKIALRSQSR